jgi:hypothetical protein
MPLSDDQRAMLRLLAQREQGYEDLAALMGLSVGEVRAKVNDALEQLEEEGQAPPPVPPEPPPVEQPQEPMRPAEPVEEAPPPPAKRAEAPEPGAAPPRASAGSVERTRPSRPQISLPSSNGGRAAIAAGAAVVVALIVALVVGGGGGSSDTTTTASGNSAAAAEETANTTAANGKEVTRAILNPVGGGNAKGAATFGRVKNSLALQVEATGLAPTAKGQSYTVWLYESAKKMLPLAATTVGKSGKVAAQVEVPTEVLAYLAKETFDQIDISLTSDATLKASLAKATSEKKAPVYTGTDVLRGRITGPIVGAASR